MQFTMFIFSKIHKLILRNGKFIKNVNLLRAFKVALKFFNCLLQ